MKQNSKTSMSIRVGRIAGVIGEIFLPDLVDHELAFNALTAVFDRLHLVHAVAPEINELI